MNPLNTNPTFLHPPSASSSASSVSTNNISPTDQKAAISNSKVLDVQQKKLYSQMIDCVARYGTENNQELFNAAGHCFDRSFGPNTCNNIITIAEYNGVMGEEKTQGTLGENDYISPDFFAHDRPGFFLLTPYPVREVRFLKEKEGDKDALVLYDPKTDTFIESASMPVTGREKLVIPNRSKEPVLATFYGHPTPDVPVEGKFYHEKQDDRKCGIHAVHAFLGYPVINETQLSLMKLEEITKSTFPLEIPGRQPLYFYLGNRKYMDASEVDLSGFTPSQIAHYKNATRFRFAQTSFYQSDLGADKNDLLMILKSMAAQGIIDQKYSNARRYEININEKSVEYAKNKGLFLESQAWDIDVITRALNAVNSELANNRSVIEDLDQRLEKHDDAQRQHIQLNPTDSQYLTQEHWASLKEKRPYDTLQAIKRDLELSLIGMNELKNEFQRSDRLIIASDSEDHNFTMRKCENDDWVVIDSEESEQIRTSNPLKWIMERQKSFFEATGHSNYDFITIASPQESSSSSQKAMED